MAKQLNQYNSDIETGDIIKPEHITQFAKAFTGEEAYDVAISGSLMLNGNPVATNDLNGTNYVMVYGVGTPTENGAELQAAYDAAKNMPRYLGDVTAWETSYYYKGQTFTDNITYYIVNTTMESAAYDLVDTTEITETEAKSVRTTVIVAPGDYGSNNPLILNTDYINVVSLTGNADVLLNTVVFSANNVHHKGIKIKSGASTNNSEIGDNLDNFTLENFEDLNAGALLFNAPTKSICNLINCNLGINALLTGFSLQGYSVFMNNCTVGDESIGDNSSRATEISNCKFENCKIYDFTYLDLAIQAGAAVIIKDCEITIFNAGYNYEFNFINCKLNTGSWSGIGNKRINCINADWSLSANL